MTTVEEQLSEEKRARQKAEAELATWRADPLGMQVEGGRQRVLELEGQLSAEKDRADEASARVQGLLLDDRADLAAERTAHAETRRKLEEADEGLEAALELIEEQRTAMAKPYCFHCGAENPSHDPARPHWLDCEKHPAHIALDAARAEVERLRARAKALEGLLDETVIEMGVTKLWFAEEAESGQGDAWRFRDRLAGLLLKLRSAAASSDRAALAEGSTQSVRCNRAGCEDCESITLPAPPPSDQPAAQPPLEVAAVAPKAEGAGTTHNCRACRFSYMEPDSGLICGHPDAGSFGLTIYSEPLAHCPEFSKFQQHPLRNADGSLKP